MNIDPDNDIKLYFWKLQKKIVKIVKLRKKLGDMIKSDKKNSQVSELVDRYHKKVLISSPPNPPLSFLASSFKSFITITSSNFMTKLDDEKIKQLTEIIQSLAFSVRIFQTHIS